MIELAQLKFLYRITCFVATWLLLTVLASAEPVITEFMAANATTLADEDGTYSDWLEVHNPDAAPVSLSGWYLTDTASSKKKWQFPDVTLPSDGYIIVWASNKNRRDPSRPLHTNFALSAGGEYLGLIKPDGTTVVSEYAPTFPAQSDDISYGTSQPTNGSAPQVGYFRRPTPGAANAELMLLETVTLSQDAAPFSAPFQLSLSGASASQHIRYVLAAPSASGAAIPDPDATSLLYTGPITIDSSVIVRAAVFSADDSEHGLATTAQYQKLDPTLSSFTSRLPVMVIDNHGFGPEVKDGIDHPAWLYTYNAQGSPAPVFSRSPDLISPITESVRGASSADFPKKGYNFKLNDDLGNKVAKPIFDLSGSYEKWSLVNPWFTDRSYIHNSFIYALSNRIGRWAPRVQMTELFFNSDGGSLSNASYAGLYALTDRIEVNTGRVAIKSISGSDVTAPAVTGGYIVKLDLRDDDEYGWITNHGLPAGPESAVVVAYPKAADLAPAQQDYIRNYVQGMEDALFADQAAGFGSRTYLDYIDRPSWVDFHILNTFALNLDALERSTYFTKDRGGKMVAGPVWDFDRAFNSGDQRGADPRVWSIPGATDYWRTGWFGLIAQDPEFMQDWIDRWQSLRQTELSNTKLTTLAGTLADTVGNQAAARDAARWPDNAPRYDNGYAGEVSALKTWLTDRASWIDQQFAAAPMVTNSGGSLVFTAPAGAQLAYTLDGSDPRSLGGAIAPNAVLTSAPLTVASDANVHVRTYRAEMKNVFPGSPWSSAVASEASSPLLPAAKLINLSSRALIGGGQSALIAGVVVADTQSKSFLARGVGPTLGVFGAANTIPDPVLSIFRNDGAEIFRNSGWQSGPDATNLPAISKSVGAFALTDQSHDDAMVSPLAAGAYTMQISSETGQGGVGLAELYALDDNGRTINLSTRAMVRSGEGALIGGFVVQGPAYKRMLVRAVGPALAGFGVENVLNDPVLKIYSGTTVVATVDDWSTAPTASVTAAATGVVGTFALPNGSKDAALFITLPPGAYTVEISSKDGSEGIALLEIYDVP